MCLSEVKLGQEFFINSQELENKIRQLLPSQGGAGAGFDLSASTQIVPIIDLTESAEGSNVRADLQTSLSFNTASAFSVANATDTVLINNTGFYRVFGSVSCEATGSCNFELDDTVTSKRIFNFNAFGTNALENIYDFNVFIEAGQRLLGTASAGGALRGVTRQIADIDGNLVDA